MENKKFIPLNELEVYKLAREYSRVGWQIYQSLNWKQQKIIGDQAITSIDSVGGNIAEGYGRFHYSDKVKFYYYARGSLLESKHWLDLLFERKLITKETYYQMMGLYTNIKIKLNQLINSQYQRKRENGKRKGG